MAKREKGEKRPPSGLYSFYYAFGMYVLLRLSRFFRYLRRELRPMYIWLRNGLRRTVGAWFCAIGRKFAVLFSALGSVFVGRTVRFRRHPFAATGEIFSRFAGVVRSNPRAFGRVAAVGAPLLAVAALAVTLSYWTSATFGIEVVYEARISAAFPMRRPIIRQRSLRAHAYMMKTERSPSVTRRPCR